MQGGSGRPLALVIAHRSLRDVLHRCKTGVTSAQTLRMLARHVELRGALHRCNSDGAVPDGLFAWETLRRTIHWVASCIDARGAATGGAAVRCIRNPFTHAPLHGVLHRCKKGMEGSPSAAVGTAWARAGMRRPTGGRQLRARAESTRRARQAGAGCGQPGRTPPSVDLRHCRAWTIVHVPARPEGREQRRDGESTTIRSGGRSRFRALLRTGMAPLHGL